MNDINQAKTVRAMDEVTLGYSVVEKIESIVAAGGTVLDISDVFTLVSPVWDKTTSTVWRVGRTILFHQSEVVA